MSKVLVVDDDAEIRAALTDVLREEAFQVAEAANGQEALDLLRRERGKWILLLDLMMPCLSGQALIQVLEQELDLLEATQVILMSAGWRLARVRQVPQSDLVSGALTKPFDLEQLLALVRLLAR